MSFVSLRSVVAPLVGAAICLALSPRPGATAKQTMTARFVARAVSPLDAKDGGPIEIVIERWSTDDDLENLRAALLAHGAAFQRARPEAGVVLMPGVQSLGARVLARRTLAIQFAREIQTLAGRQVVIATDQHLGFGEPPARTRVVSATDQHPDSGEKTGNAPSPDPEFTLLDVRFGPDGKGVGKLAPAAKVVYNPVKKIFEIENYAAQPVRLSEVKSATP